MEKSIRHVIGETGIAGVVAFCRRRGWCVAAGKKWLPVSWVGRLVILGLVLMIFGLVAAGVAVAQEGGIAPVPPPNAASPPVIKGESKDEGLLTVIVADGKVTLAAREADLTVVLKRIAEAAGIEVEVGPGVAGTVTLTLTDEPIEKAIEQVLEAAVAKNFAAHFDLEPVTAKLQKVVVFKKEEQLASPKGVLSSARSQELIANLKEGSVSKKRDTFAELLRAGKAAVPVLLEGITTDDPAAQVTAIYLLREMGIKEAVPLILPQIDADNKSVQHEAILSLGHLRDTRATKPLIAKLGRLTRDESGARTAIALSLGLSGDQKAVPVLESMLDDEDPVTQCYAAGALGLLGNLKGFDVALRASQSDVPQIQTAALRALGEIGDTRAIPVLEGLLADPKFANREYAHIALQRLRMVGRGVAEKAELLEADVGKKGMLGEWAAFELKKIGTPEAITVLKRNVVDGVGRSREPVVRHLYFLGVDPYEGERP